MGYRNKKRSAELLVDSSKKIKLANKELEAFSYSVFHDLRAPLRAIDGFSRILLDEYTDKLDKEGCRLMDIIVDSTKKMGVLIDDLLSFSRLGRQDLATKPINMQTLAADIVKDLSVQEKDRDIQFVVGALPPAKGDLSMIRQVIVTLLDNAVKFTGKNEATRIEIGGCEDTIYNTYWVKDNGVGFNMQYKDKLFRVFERLHSKKDFDGTGIGLSNVNRIITRHGGSVWAEGEVGIGATFYFTLKGKD